MSKQLKYKFKKTLKKAEFIHADLEYHEEVLPEAKKLFSEAVAEIIDNLSPEEQKVLQGIRETRQQQELVARERADRAETMEYDESEVQGVEGTEICPSDETGIDEVGEAVPDASRSSEVKKLFRQIAERTHPDKAQARGFSVTECSRLEAIFKKAHNAYNNKNWYILYSIAGDLDIPIETLPQDCLEWVEDDIRQTMVQISHISHLLAWMWLNGNNATKDAVIEDYFRQTYGQGLSKDPIG